MATPAHHLIQDQNIYSGSTFGGKTDLAKTDKKAGLGGRKALNDISNSRNPSACQPFKKENSANVLPTGKDLGASKKINPVGGKANFSKASEKGKVGGRKALSGLTKSARPSLQQASKKSQKLTAITEEKVPLSILEEGFLHNHEECIKVQRKAMDMEWESFLKEAGLHEEIAGKLWTQNPILSPDSNPPSPWKPLELEELPESPFKGWSRPSPSPGCPSSPELRWTHGDLPPLELIKSPFVNP